MNDDKGLAVTLFNVVAIIFCLLGAFTWTLMNFLAPPIILVCDGLALALFVGLMLFMSIGAITQKSNTVGLTIAFVLVLATAGAGVISLLSPTPSSSAPPYTGDYIAAALAIAVAGASVLVIVGLTLVLAIPAIFSRRDLVTSWPSNAEVMFQPHEMQMRRTQGIAWMPALAIASAVFAVVAIINLTVEPKKNDLGKDMNMSNVSKKTPAAAPAPAPTPAPAPAQGSAPAP
jgi:hypothetical protein